jgi:hypothetical protein
VIYSRPTQPDRRASQGRLLLLTHFSCLGGDVSLIHQPFCDEADHLAQNICSKGRNVHFRNRSRASPETADFLLTVSVTRREHGDEQGD